ncbi:hypothetical protein OIO90_002319 [Microbotryomycetes sp. JL221]|nr:hypothetical protein OIO90_002319 [Microbotryomycetes sp. JL221]
MRFNRLASLALLPTLWSTASAQINVDLGDLLGLDLDISLLTDGALINANLFADLLTTTSCQGTGKTVGIQALLFPLLKVCACVDLLAIGGIVPTTPCPACPTNSSPVCGGAGTCACQCDAGFYAAADGSCKPNDTCPPPNVLVPLPSDPRKAECQCAPGYVTDGAGGCVLIPSARARMHRKKNVVAHPHAARAARQARAPRPQATQEVFVAKPAPVEVAVPAGVAQPPTPVSNATTDKFSCPNGETACPLKSGGFECLDVSSSLTSCGGCVGEGLPGVNCLAIPGALNVECQNSQCQVASCFKGWRFMSGKCV